MTTAGWISVLILAVVYTAVWAYRLGRCDALHASKARAAAFAAKAAKEIDSDATRHA